MAWRLRFESTKEGYKLDYLDYVHNIKLSFESTKEGYKRATKQFKDFLKSFESTKEGYKQSLECGSMAYLPFRINQRGI